MPNCFTSVVKKVFLSAGRLLHDSFRLGKLVLDSGWRPDVLVAIWRGGTPVGVAVHELLDYRGVATIHMAAKCRSYSGIGRRGRVVFENADVLFAAVRHGHRVLVVDDIFDSGGTARAAVGLLEARGAEVRLATLYWKRRANRTNLRPHYHVRETDAWIVFPHELDGLTPAEVRRKNPALHRLLFGRLPAHASVRSSTVTGPSFTSRTCMLAPNTPAPTRASPSSRRNRRSSSS
jgi:hypoxanthine phosphoribosyltransferase